MQDALDEEEIFRMDDMLENFGDMDSILAFQKDMDQYRIGENEYCTAMRKIFRVFSKLEVLKEDWPEYVKKAEFTLYADGQSAYESNRRAFHKTIGLKSGQYEEWANYLEQLMVYFVFTYCIYHNILYNDYTIFYVKTQLFYSFSPSLNFTSILS